MIADSSGGFRGPCRPRQHYPTNHKKAEFFDNAADINNLHRKVGIIIERDLLSVPGEMHRLFTAVGLTIGSITDDRLGYLFCATRTREARS